MKFLSYKLTLVAVLAIFLASCAGDDNKDKTNEKDKIKEPVVQTFTPVGTVWENNYFVDDKKILAKRIQAEFISENELEIKLGGMTATNESLFGVYLTASYSYDKTKGEVLIDKDKKIKYVRTIDQKGTTQTVPEQAAPTAFAIFKNDENNLKIQLNKDTKTIQVNVNFAMFNPFPFNPPVSTELKLKK